MTEYIPATNRGQKAVAANIPVTSSSQSSVVTVGKPIIQKQIVTKTLMVTEDEVTALEYLLRNCEGDIIDKLKRKLMMLNYNIR